MLEPIVHFITRSRTINTFDELALLGHTSTLVLRINFIRHNHISLFHNNENYNAQHISVFTFWKLFIRPQNYQLMADD